MYPHDEDEALAIVAQKFPDNTEGRITPQMARDGLAAVIAHTKNRPPNFSPGADLRVRFETAAQLLAAGGPAAGDCLEEEDDANFCLGQLAWVEFPLRGFGVSFRLMYDPDPARRPGDGKVWAYRTGRMVVGARLQARWVRLDDPIAGVPTYAYLQAVAGAGGYAFKVGDPIRDFAGTNAEYFFAAQVDGPLPAPTSAAGDANWRRIAPEDVLPAAYDDTVVRNLLDDVQGNVADLRVDMGDVQTLVVALQTGKVEVWQPGPKYANRVYFLIGGISTGLYQPKADIGNSTGVSLAYYHALWVAPGNAFTANQTAAITNANAPSANNKFATFNDLPSANGTPAPPPGFVGFAAPRQMLWLRGYPGQVNSGYEASNGTSVSRLSVINPNNWPGLFAAVQDVASSIRSPRLWCKRIEVYTSWDGPGYDQRFRLRVFNGADDALLVDKIVAIDQSSRYYNYGGGWDWYRVGGGDGNTPSWVEILPAYLDCYVVINYVSGGQFIQSGIDIY